MSIECPLCLRPLPPVGTVNGQVKPRTGDEAMLLQLVAEGADTVRAVASRLTGEPSPGRATLERVRRRLNACVRAGLLTSAPGTPGGMAGSTPDRYRVRRPPPVAG